MANNVSYLFVFLMLSIHVNGMIKDALTTVSKALADKNYIVSPISIQTHLSILRTTKFVTRFSSTLQRQKCHADGQFNCWKPNVNLFALRQRLARSSNADPLS